MINLTTLEQVVLDALKRNADDCSGGDFAIAEEVNMRGSLATRIGYRMSRQQFGALLTCLQAKGLVRVDVTYINGNYRSKGTRVTQVSFNAGAR